MHVSTGTCGGRITCNLSRNYTDEDEYPEDPLFLYDEITAFLVWSVARSRPQYRRGVVNDRFAARLPLRASLFSHVSPYVEFELDAARATGFPTELSDHLDWELTPTTPKIVRQVVAGAGYRLVSGSTNWCGSWSDALFAFRFKALKEHQKINHFPGAYEIGHKDRLCRNMRRLIGLHGRKQFDFVPDTYVLPNDFEIMRSGWERGRRNKWILKPPASSRGRGIRLVSKFSRIPRTDGRTIVQRYISRPRLIHGAKFDIRLYALVTSFDPLRIYVYDEGLVRFACDRYENSPSNLDNHFMHLTNYSVNRSSSRYRSNDDVDSCKGHKWSLGCLWSHLDSHGVDTSALLRRIHDIVVKTVISGERTINSFSRVYLASRYSCFELLGFDVLLDENAKPWLLEVNVSPSLQTPSALDTAVKGPLVRDVLNIVGYQVPANLPGAALSRLAAKYSELGATHFCQDFRVHDKELSKMERIKQARYSRERDRRDDSIIETLTPDDARHLILYEDELASAGGFRKIFPTKDTRRYFKYFNEVSYYNLLFDAWERTYGAGDSREDGILRLRDLSERKFHLRRS